jgi:hypothetical protein
VTEYAGALEAVDRIVNRGGDADDVVRAVLAALHERGVAAAIRFAGGGELAAGDGAPGLRVPIVRDGERIGELEAAADDEAFVARVATLISPYVRP